VVFGLLGGGVGLVAEDAVVGVVGSVVEGPRAVIE